MNKCLPSSLSFRGELRQRPNRNSTGPNWSGGTGLMKMIRKTICAAALTVGAISPTGAFAADSNPTGLGIGIGEFIFTSKRDIKDAIIDDQGIVRVKEV